MWPVMRRGLRSLRRPAAFRNSRPLGTVVVGTLVDDNGPADDIAYLEPVGKESHQGIAVVGEMNGEIPGMVAVRLVIGVPVPARRPEGVCGIADCAVAAPAVRP